MPVKINISTADAERLFPCDNDDGRDIQASDEAKAMAAEALGCTADQLSWHLPDIFAVRYGSNYVASASYKGTRAQFLTDEGEFKEGDDKA